MEKYLENSVILCKILYASLANNGHRLIMVGLCYHLFHYRDTTIFTINLNTLLAICTYIVLSTVNQLVFTIVNGLALVKLCTYITLRNMKEF